MPALDLAHAIQNRLPEIAEHYERAPFHRFFVEHFPHNGELNERTCAALARDIAVAEAHQFKQALLPGGYTRLFLHPAIRTRAEKTGRHGEYASAGIARTARHGFHHAAVAPSADRKAGRSERAAEFQGFQVIRVAILWTRTPKYSDDSCMLAH